MFHVPNQHRIRSGHPLASDDSYGNNGAFVVPFESYTFMVIASDGAGWEHVSISLPTRDPSWKQMCAIKDMFWDPEDLVVQFHPPESEYVNNHEHCLHLWRAIARNMPAPEAILVGYKDLNHEK